MILFTWLVMTWAGNCQPFLLRDAVWLQEESPDSCIELIRGPLVTDEVLV